MEREENSIAKIMLRGIVATIGIDETLSLLSEIEEEYIGVLLTEREKPPVKLVTDSAGKFVPVEITPTGLMPLVPKVEVPVITPLPLMEKAEIPPVRVRNPAGKEKAYGRVRHKAWDEDVEKATCGIVEGLQSLSEPFVKKADFLRGICEKYRLTYGAGWEAHRNLEEKGIVVTFFKHDGSCSNRVKWTSLTSRFSPGEGTLFSLSRKSPSPDKPSFAREMHKTPSPKAVTLPRCKEIIYEHLLLHPEGRPREWLVALCMFKNFSHGVARAAILELEREGKVYLGRMEMEGISLPSVHLKGSEK